MYFRSIFYSKIFVWHSFRVSPHRGAVEVHHEPLWRVESETVGELNAVHPDPELRADEGGPGVGGIHVEPHLLIFAWNKLERLRTNRNIFEISI